MTSMFYNCINFNQPLNNWDVKNVTEMDNMFESVESFNHSV